MSDILGPFERLAATRAAVSRVRAGPDQPRRVALFSGNYNYLRDGANQALNRLVGYLERDGVDVRVYSPTSPRPAFAPKGTLVSVPSVRIPGRGEYRLGLGLPAAVRRDVERFRPDIVHLSAPDWTGVAAQRRGGGCGGQGGQFGDRRGATGAAGGSVGASEEQLARAGEDGATCHRSRTSLARLR